MLHRLIGKPAAALQALVVLCAVPLQPAATRAAAPQVRTQAPGFYRMMLGEIEVTALLDGTHPFPVDTVMPDVSRGAIDRALKRDALGLPL